MIEEQYVSRDTALMLKEAGFDVPIYKHYTKTGAIWTSAIPEKYNDKMDYMCFPCPTQALAARWLRDVHNVHVFAFYQYHTRMWAFYIQRLYSCSAEAGMTLSLNEYETPELAMETGLQEAVKLIKKERV